MNLFDFQEAQKSYQHEMRAQTKQFCNENLFQSFLQNVKQKHKNEKYYWHLPKKMLNLNQSSYVNFQFDQCCHFMKKRFQEEGYKLEKWKRIDPYTHDFIIAVVSIPSTTDTSFEQPSFFDKIKAMWRSG